MRFGKMYGVDSTTNFASLLLLKQFAVSQLSIVIRISHAICSDITAHGIARREDAVRRAMIQFKESRRVSFDGKENKRSKG